MFNLLPRQHIRRIWREYYLRLFSVLFVFAGIWGLLSAVFLVPSYVAVRAERSAILGESKQYQETEFHTERDDAVRGAVREANRDVAVLGAWHKKASSSSLLRRVIGARPGGIFISSFFYEAKESGEDRIVVRGTADTREALIAFTDALRREDAFENVDLPISNLAKDRDIAFSLIITGAF